MKLSIRTELDYTFPQTTDVLLQLEAAMIPEQVVEHAHIDLPPAEHFARLPGHNCIGDRIWLRINGPVSVRYESIVEVNRLSAEIAALPAVPPHELPGETIEYLMPSRYCPSDEFLALVAADFGQYQGGARVAAICDWIANAIEYSSGSSSTSTDAMETYVKRRGVCRDYAHLLIAMVRASAIPARFTSVYAPHVDPPDFHAVAEVFLGGAWYPVDATGMAKTEDFAKIGVGRDAADVSFMTSYGPAEMNRQSISVSAV